MKNAAVAIGFPVGVIPALQTRDPSQNWGSMVGLAALIDQQHIYVCITFIASFANPPSPSPTSLVSLRCLTDHHSRWVTVPPLTLSYDPPNPYTALEMSYGHGGDANGVDE
ncbi:hypothetical protein BO83DRAFT_250244 [Aspergillus eucalypticola CBS 122712]|uniref:Uncharacterized protein n=1 Tax=Aspergillus eucalypticola (strain CBS 122712 / IBT 29274) TaxID=1448314 RepID=A0A317VNM3_ASPEC|nr:uncharacterized protein BO83DRAFT_250244 [Aspergillus eucalypticola CBS 122712]PWY75926.1 hypothetical protein BO83DRAFT_250244 [Aspergillus eucalypticola CBS 122712]